MELKRPPLALDLFLQGWGHGCLAPLIHYQKPRYFAVAWSRISRKKGPTIYTMTMAYFLPNFPKENLDREEHFSLE